MVVALALRLACCREKAVEYHHNDVRLPVVIGSNAFATFGLALYTCHTSKGPVTTAKGLQILVAMASVVLAGR